MDIVSGAPRKRFRSLAFALALALSLLVPAAPRAQSCAQLMGAVAARTRVGSVDLSLTSGAAKFVDSIKSELAVAGAGIVVYLPVASANKMALLRFESNGNGVSPSEDVVKQSTMTEGVFRKALSAAQQPTNAYFKRVMHDEFPRPQNRDQGKTVLLTDSNSYGLAPQSLGMSGTTVFASASITRTLNNLRRLATHRRARLLALRSACRAIPMSIKTVFSTTAGKPNRYPPLEKWAPYATEVEAIAKRNGVRVLTPPVDGPRQQNKRSWRNSSDLKGLSLSSHTLTALRFG